MKYDVRKIEKELEGLVDKKYQKGLTATVPSTWNIRGVRVPELKRIAKEHSQRTKTGEDYLATLEYLDRAFGLKDRELAIIGINMLKPYKKFFDKDLVKKTKGWISVVQDWEICDNLSYWIISELFIRDLLTEKDLLYLRDHENLFARRAYIVCRILPLRKGWGDTRKNLEDISFFVDAKENYMVKALSWALRGATKSAPDQVSLFIEEYRDRLHPLIVREVTNKLEKGTKK